MKVSRFQNNIDIQNKTNEPNFKGNPIVGLATYLDERVILGKAVLDASALDAPQIIMANNSDERREKINKSTISFAMGYLSPLVTLPLTNRLGMRYAGRLTKSLMSNNHKAIYISNKYLKDSDSMMRELRRMSAKTTSDPFDLLFNKIVPDKKISQVLNVDELLQSCNGDKELLRKRLINAKNSVLAFDLLFTSASIGYVGFFNNWQTKRKTQQDGYSAEFSMADKDIVEKRAEKFKKQEPLRFAYWLGVLTALTLSPLLLKKGLTSQQLTKFNKYIKKIAPNFDYTDGIFMKRLPFFMSGMGLYSGIILASRNETEMKDTSIRSVSTMLAYFGGDILIGSILGRLSDKYFNTKLMKQDVEKTFLNKLIPPTRPLKELTGKNKTVGGILYWVNLAMLGACMGFGIPYLINKMIRRDVEKDVQLQKGNNIVNS